MPTALITGGNRGLGLEAARQLAAAGYHVMLTARSAQAGAKAARALEVEFRPLDVSYPASITALAEGLARDRLTLDVLINNAGVALEGFDARVAEETLAVNYFGAAALTDALLPRVADQGTVVMVSSGMGELSCVSAALREELTAPELTRAQLDQLMHGFVKGVAAGTHALRGWPSSAYRASKVGLNAWVRVCSREPRFTSRGLHLNAVCPGWVRTDLGGAGAPRSVEVGAASILAAATRGPSGPTGGFFRDGAPASW